VRDKFCVDFDASPAKISKVMRKSKAVLHPDKYTSAENKEIQIL
jgi:DnaJ-class molecular chaperone